MAELDRLDDVVSHLLSLSLIIIIDSVHLWMI